MQKSLKHIISLVVLIILGTLNSYACNCSGEGSVKGSVKYYDAVFSGRVLSKKLTTNYDSLGVVITGDSTQDHFKWRELPTMAVKIEVSKMFKGRQVSDTLTILTPFNGAACGYNFQIGQKYIIYGSIYDELPMTDTLKRRSFDRKTFWTHLCTRTRNWNQQEETEITEIKK